MIDICINFTVYTKLVWCKTVISMFLHNTNVVSYLKNKKIGLLVNSHIIILQVRNVSKHHEEWFVHFMHFNR